MRPDQMLLETRFGRGARRSCFFLGRRARAEMNHFLAQTDETSSQVAFATVRNTSDEERTAAVVMVFQSKHPVYAAHCTAHYTADCTALGAVLAAAVRSHAEICTR